jgi:hypothetical protein
VDMGGEECGNSEHEADEACWAGGGNGGVQLKRTADDDEQPMLMVALRPVGCV